jgi:hypothetical protein
MHNVNVDAVEQTAAKAAADPAAVIQRVTFDGEWQAHGAQFRASIPIPHGRPVLFEADFPPPMGGTGTAPNPLAYCFWGGLACYAMTYAPGSTRRSTSRAPSVSAKSPRSTTSTGTSSSTPTRRPTLSISSNAQPTTTAPAPTASATP